MCGVGTKTVYIDLILQQLQTEQEGEVPFSNLKEVEYGFGIHRREEALVTQGIPMREVQGRGERGSQRGEKYR